ncbi:MAG TPA: biotin/lipoyl-binding protein, partial [Thermoanaerobaculia bacterium]|nr:biotin/lipoyl-binding protein [Thermoanaerobaculia bacterium]
MTAGRSDRPAARSLLARRGGAAAIAAAAAAAIAFMLRARVPAVEAWRVARTTVSPVAVGRGTILPPAAVTVFPRVIGRVARVLVTPGGTVRSGDPLIELDGAAYTGQV